MATGQLKSEGVALLDQIALVLLVVRLLIVFGRWLAAR
jgi:hypothetical protein